MANWYPSRRILGSPAWLWVSLAIPLFLLAYWVPKEDQTDNDGFPEEPTDLAAITREHIFVARQGDSFRFVQFDQRDAEGRAFREMRKTKSPLWQVGIALSDKQEEIWNNGASYLLPGLIHRESRWNCALKTRRLDDAFFMEKKEHGLDWDGGKENPSELPPEQICKLTPVLVAELNHRHSAAKLGDRLEKMLNEGLEDSSTSFPPENALVLLRYLALLMALVGLCSMFIRPRAVPVPGGALPMSDNEVLLIKIAAVRKSLRNRYKNAS